MVTTVALVAAGCQSGKQEPNNMANVRLVTLDPGHFHAALVQKIMYEDVDSVVNVYAPDGNDLQLHLDRVNGYNNRKENPTHWNEEVYRGADYLEKMLSEKKGNVVVLAGNNQKKTEYILKSLEAGFNVLADKPMVIDNSKFEMLKKAFETAKSANLLLYDIMTERFEINTILQRELAMLPEVFGQLQTGSAKDPAVIMESGHCFYKYVSGNVLTRPAWFMDASQQGAGIVDVTTHLVDLVQWECFPNQILDYLHDISVDSARRWPTNMSLSQFNTITKLNGFPAYLKNKLTNDTTLQVFSNGEINYSIKGIHARVKVQWDYTSEAGGDTHYSYLKGTRANLVIRQGKEENYKPVLYIETAKPDTAYASLLRKHLSTLNATYPGIGLQRTAKGWRVTVPDNLAEGHEAHFGRVMNNFLEYLKKKNIPDWEVPNMLAKYYTTTRALELAQKDQR
jgi:predicted dehydrogenase